MLFRTLLLLVFASIALGGCAAQRALDSALAASADAELARRPDLYTNGDSRAWLVRKDDQVRGLLWGTVHVAYDSDMVLPRAIRARFYGAADLTVETVIDRLTRAEQERLRTIVDTADAAADPDALRALDQPTRGALDQAVPREARRRLSLRGLATLVTDLAVTAKAIPPDSAPETGFVDLDLIAFARAQDRPVLGLEPPRLPDPTLLHPNGVDAAGRLRLALRRAPTLEAMGQWSRAAYAQGEAARAVAVLFAWQASKSDLRHSDVDRVALLDRRNATWLPELRRTFDRPGQHFVAVGVAHLLGEHGLVAGLRRLGFVVTPCRPAACG